jgi:hypothetical protein
LSLVCEALITPIGPSLDVRDMRPRTLGSLTRFICMALLASSFACPCVRGGVGVVLNESLDTSAQWVTGSGHTSIYFSRICPASPVRLRLCRPGEHGSVMSNYINLGENQRYEWNIVPLDVYLYGVENPRDRPLFGSPKLKSLLEQTYRTRALSKYCYAETCITSEKAEWKEMVGATLSRSMYIFYVDTSREQDLRIIAEFNSLPNENHFSGVTDNCADFAKRILDTYFPHAAHRDVIDDFGMTSPKAVARTFSHYALQHPDLQFCVLHFSQLPGTIKRSTQPHDGTEQLFRSKKLLIPMAIFANHELSVVAAAYFLHGRFCPESEFEARPAMETATLPDRSEPRLVSTDEERPSSLLRIPETRQDRIEIVGTAAEWNKYREQFKGIVKQSVREGTIPDKAYVDQFFAQLDRTGEPFIGRDGSLWISVSYENSIHELGVGANSIFAPGSDRRLAFVFLLARINQVLKSPKHRRETILEFREDWARLQYARARSARDLASLSSQPGPGALSPAAKLSRGN